MRNIAEIIKDDKNGKQLSQAERQIAVAYIQGKYDAAMELKICNNSTIMEILENIRAEIEEAQNFAFITHEEYEGLRTALKIINKYKDKAESEVKI